MPAVRDLPAAVFFDTHGTLISWAPERPTAQVIAERLWAAEPTALRRDRPDSGG